MHPFDDIQVKREKGNVLLATDFFMSRTLHTEDWSLAYIVSDFSPCILA